MPEDLIENETGLDITSRSGFSRKDNMFTSRSFAALLAKNIIPYSHRKIADSYVIIKKIFKFHAVSARITNTEKSLLNKFDFNILEYTTADKMYEELAQLQQWAMEEDTKDLSDNILSIRAKELRYITATKYAALSNEIHKGYIVLENYFWEISKYGY